MPWIDSIKPAPPALIINDGRDSLVFHFEKGSAQDTLRGFAVYKTTGTFPTDSSGSYNLDSERVFLFIPNNEKPKLVLKVKDLQKNKNERYLVTAISKTNNESEPIPLYPVTVSAP